MDGDDLAALELIEQFHDCRVEGTLLVRPRFSRIHDGLAIRYPQGYSRYETAEASPLLIAISEFKRSSEHDTKKVIRLRVVRTQESLKPKQKMSPKVMDSPRFLFRGVESRHWPQMLLAELM